MSTIRRMIGGAILFGALTAVSPGYIWAQATGEAPAKDVVDERKPHAELVVENNHWLDAHVYLVRGGVRTSLGFMFGLGKREFQFPSSAILPGDDVQILVRLIGGGSYLTPVVHVNSGEVVQVTVENSLVLSTVGVFPAA